MRLPWGLFALVVALVCTPVVPAQSAPLTPELQKALDSSKHVYVQSARKDGTLGKAAEIWFMPYNGAVWVASPPSTYRVKPHPGGPDQSQGVDWQDRRSGVQRQRIDRQGS